MEKFKTKLLGQENIEEIFNKIIDENDIKLKSYLIGNYKHNITYIYNNIKNNINLQLSITSQYFYNETDIIMYYDETKILKETVLDPIGEGLKNIVRGKRFIVQKQDSNTLLTEFDYCNITKDLTIICDVPTHLVVVGDLKFYFQILGRENMSGSWCIWCQRHPSDWPLLCTMENRNREDETMDDI